VTSHKVLAPDKVFFRWPANQVGESEMQSWVDEHTEGTSILVHYDPVKHAKVVLVDTDMPLGDAKHPATCGSFESSRQFPPRFWRSG
jgi:hypothetical protein